MVTAIKGGECSLEKVLRVVRRSFIGAIAPYVAVLLSMSAYSAFAADDDYLQSLEAEVDKVEHGVDPAVSQKSRSEMEAQRAAFEELMEDQYRGTYVFYKRLSERSKQEVFLRYAGGASFKDVREMIVDRSMN